MSALLALHKNWRLIGFALVVGPLLFWGLFQRMDARHWHKKYINEAAAHVADNTRWEEAQALANARATSAKLAREATDKRKQENADARYAALAADYSRALRMRPNASGQSASLASNLPGSPAAPEGAHGPGEAAELHPPVCLSDEDANILIINTARLQASHEWALDTQASGGK